LRSELNTATKTSPPFSLLAAAAPRAESLREPEGWRGLALHLSRNYTLRSGTAKADSLQVRTRISAFRGGIGTCKPTEPKPGGMRAIVRQARDLSCAWRQPEPANNHGPLPRSRFRCIGPFVANLGLQQFILI
jgi:hypothetical protein